MRLFVAVNLPQSVRDTIQSAIDDFPVSNPPWRWAAPQTWHFTLKFLGETEAARVDDVITALDSVIARHAAFDMRLGAFGGFPHLRAPRVLFFQADKGSAQMEQLAHDVDIAIEKAIGLPTEVRAFRAHVTIARVKEPLSPAITERLKAVPALSGAVTRVASFDLMQSRLQRTGAVYSVVKEFALS